MDKEKMMSFLLIFLEKGAQSDVYFFYISSINVLYIYARFIMHELLLEIPDASAKNSPIAFLKIVTSILSCPIYHTFNSYFIYSYAHLQNRCFNV